jgi:hypothetical protein
MSLELHRKVKPEAVASKEDSRYAERCRHPWYEPNEIGKPSGHVFATNGKAAVAIPVIADSGEPMGQLPREALAAFRKNAVKAKGTRPELPIWGVDDEVSCRGKSLLVYKREPMPDGSPAPVLSVIPKRVEDNAARVIYLNARLLADLATALGVDSVRLQFADPRSPIRVEPLTDDPDVPVEQACGALMPIVVEPSKKSKK